MSLLNQFKNIELSCRGKDGDVTCPIREQCAHYMIDHGPFRQMHSPTPISNNCPMFVEYKKK